MRLTALALAAVMLAACADTSQEMPPIEEADLGNEWIILFDGSDLDAFRGFNRADVPGAWAIQDSLLAFVPGTDDGGDLITREQFGDFELELEWKIGEAANSGIIYRATEEFGAPWMTGPEYQILDNDAHPDADFGDDRKAGANYDMQPSDTTAVRPVGEWNQARIVADSLNVQHWLNGVMVAEYELYSDEWNELVANSKWADYPEYGRRLVGHIALQDHGDPVWFRNIRIRGL